MTTTCDKLTTRPVFENDVDFIIREEIKATDYPWSKRNLRDGVRGNAETVLALQQDKKIGYYVVSQTAGVHEIQNIVVFRPYQRQGFGKRLLATILKHASEDGESEVWLDVRASNQAARALYNQMGFRISGVRKGYFPCKNCGREDAILMVFSGKRPEK